MLDTRFSELQIDAIIELVNMGIGKAAKALSQLVHDEVVLAVPSIEFVDHDHLLAYMIKIDSQTPSAILQKFTGDFSGNAMLIFPQRSGQSLVRKMLEGKVNNSAIDGLEEEALSEVGNIILNACFGQLGNLLSTDLDGALPLYLHSSAETILAQAETEIGCTDQAKTLLLHVDFSLRDSQTKGFVMFTMNVNSLLTFKQKIDDYLNKILSVN